MKSITAKELEENVNNGLRIKIIDVRENVEAAAGKIPAATQFPLGELPHSLEQLDKNFMVCQSGGRSAAACEFLMAQGYDVINVTGGMVAWQGEIE